MMQKAKLSYYEKLKDPRWQKKRLEVLKRENFTCEKCGTKHKTLHVHHGYYCKGFEPWQYDSWTLHCLCEDCHNDIEILTHDAQISLARLPIDVFESICLEIMRVDCEFPERTNSCADGTLASME